jgi:hypothetical protein
MEKVLIKVNSRDELHIVFNSLEDKGEKVDRSYFDYTSKNKDWNYVGFHKYINKWTVAKKYPSFKYSKIITFDEFMGNKPHYEIY